MTLNYDVSMSVICIRSMCGHECLALKNVICFVIGYLVVMEIYITFCVIHTCSIGPINICVANMGFVLLCRRPGDYRFTSYSYVTCRNVMSRRIVMIARGVMYDIRHPCQEEAL